MSALTDAQAAYRDAVEVAERARLAYVETIEHERDNGRTLDDIGDELGLTRSRVSQILTAARKGTPRA